MPFLQTETDEQFLERVGTDPALWAEAYAKMPHDRGNPDQLLPQLTAWFYNAICAGRREGIATAKAFASQPGKTPLRGVCLDTACGHSWTVAWLPMELTTAAVLMQRAACPLCGGTKVGVGDKS